MATTDEGWEQWGRLHDSTAIFQVIRQMQAQGLQVRVVKDGNASVLYTRAA